VLDKALTYHKSAKGSEAIATRTAAMTPKMRSMLILVDGKRSFDELAKLGGMLGDPEQTLSQLLELGFIEPVAGVAAPAPAPARPASAPAPASAHPTVPLADAKRYAVRRLTDLLGPGAEDLCIRIEGTKNAADFLAALQKAENVVREFSGQQAAAQFAADMKAHRPA
jgi:hypothetical protein